MESAQNFARLELESVALDLHVKVIADNFGHGGSLDLCSEVLGVAAQLVLPPVSAAAEKNAPELVDHHCAVGGSKRAAPTGLAE